MSLITTAELPPTEGVQAVWLEWDEYLLWLRGRLRSVRTSWGELVELGKPLPPGAHMALIGPTGEGKTTKGVGILLTRKWVLALDPKGEDETLAQSGFIRVRHLPRPGLRGMAGKDQRAWRDIHKRIEQGLPARVIVGGASRTDDEDLALQDLMRESIDYCRHTGGWTLYVDEFELLSSQRMYRLGPKIERMLITARRDRTSVLTSYQAQAWVSKHASRQARHVAMWSTGSREMIKAVAEDMGRDWRLVGAAIDELPAWHTLTIPRGRRGGPMVLTRAPKLVTGGAPGRGSSSTTAGSASVRAA